MDNFQRLLDLAKYDSITRLYLESYYEGRRSLEDALLCIILAKQNTITNLRAEIVLADVKGSGGC
jgi:hypothetical protein